MTVKELKPGVYMAVGGGGNSTFLVTKAGVILVDTKNMGEQQYKNLLDAIKTVTPQKVVYVFDTHHHADHTGNNEYFEKDGAKVIGQESMAEVFKHLHLDPGAPHPGHAERAVQGQGHGDPRRRDGYRLPLARRPHRQRRGDLFPGRQGGGGRRPARHAGAEL